MDMRIEFLGNREMVNHYTYSRHSQGLAFQQLPVLRGCHLSIELYYLIFYGMLGRARECRSWLSCGGSLGVGRVDGHQGIAFLVQTNRQHICCLRVAP